jgi:hypothetical protein
MPTVYPPRSSWSITRLFHNPAPRAGILRPVTAGCFISTGRSLDDAGAPEAG